MFSKSIAVLALATGLAAAKPVNVPQTLPVYKRSPVDAFGNGVSINNQNNFNNQGFDFIGNFNNFNQQQEVVQVQQQNFQLINNNGVQQQVFEQVNQVIVVDNKRNGFNNNLNNLFRSTNVRNNNRDVTTVMMVVTQVNVAVADNRGNQIQQQVFAQSIVVANRGRKETQSVMIFDSRTLIAQDIIGNGRDNGIDIGGINNNGINLIGGGVGGANGVAAPTNGAVLPTKTRGVQILGSKPTWSSVIEDPAQTNGATWEAELQALQQADQDGADNELNNQVAQQLKDAQNNQQNQDQQQQDAQAADKSE